MKKKSRVYNFSVDEIDYSVRINKNGGICDMTPKLENMFTHIQGRQLLDPCVLEHLINLIKEVHNAKKNIQY